MIIKKPFGTTPDGRAVSAFILQDGVNSAVILDYGGIVNQLLIQGCDGKTYNVVLGFDSIADYKREGGYMGALIGRVGGRIGKGKFVLDGKEYQLNCNDGQNHLHGGLHGFDDKVLESAIEDDTLVLSTVSADMEENYPGNLAVEVRYSFRNGELKLEYTAKPDRKTLINLTNHAYFNLDGEDLGEIYDHVLQIFSDTVTTADAEMISDGKFKRVNGTPYDFRQPKRIGDEINDYTDIDMKYGGGYDINYVLGKQGEYRKAAWVRGIKSGIEMEVYTDLPGIQLYTGNMMKCVHYVRRGGLCLETQLFPNEVNCPAYTEYGSMVYDADCEYHTVTVYKFMVKEVDIR